MASYYVVMGTSTAYSLQELENLSGFNSRTIRSYIQRGLIPGARGRGRAARYDPQSLDGLLFIRAVREHADLNLDQLRRLMLQLPPERIRAIGGGEEAVMSFDLGADSDHCMSACFSTPPASEPLALKFSSGLESGIPKEELSSQGIETQDTEDNSALDFIRRLRQTPNQVSSQESIQTRGTSKLERAATELDKTLAHRKPLRKARGEWWATIPITPDIELRARGLDGDDLAALERIADTLRNLISRNK